MGLISRVSSRTYRDKSKMTDCEASKQWLVSHEGVAVLLCLWIGFCANVSVIYGISNDEVAKHFILTLTSTAWILMFYYFLRNVQFLPGKLSKNVKYVICFIGAITNVIAVFTLSFADITGLHTFAIIMYCLAGIFYVYTGCLSEIEKFYGQASQTVSKRMQGGQPPEPEEGVVESTLPLNMQAPAEGYRAQGEIKVPSIADDYEKVDEKDLESDSKSSKKSRSNSVSSEKSEPKKDDHEEVITIPLKE